MSNPFTQDNHNNDALLPIHGNIRAYGYAQAIRLAILKHRLGFQDRPVAIPIDNSGVA